MSRRSNTMTKKATTKKTTAKKATTKKTTPAARAAAKKTTAAKKVVAKKAPAKKKEDKPAEKKTKKPGIIASIPAIMQKGPKAGLTKDEITDRLHKLFPEHDKVKLGATVGTQVPSRLNKAGHKITRDGKKYIIAK